MLMIMMMTAMMMIVNPSVTPTPMQSYVNHSSFTQEDGTDIKSLERLECDLNLRPQCYVTNALLHYITAHYI